MVRRLAGFILCVAVALIAASERPLTAQRGAFTMEQLLSYPFPSEMIAAPAGSTIAWTFNERGVRNIYAADAPDFKPRRVTAYKDDDGQELTNLAFSDDGKTIVYVRGGDHGANWPADANLMPNPASGALQPKMQVWSVATSGGMPKLLAEGDEPVVAPRTGRVAFGKDRRIWLAPWAVWMGEPVAGTAREVWKSGQTLADSVPRVRGGPNLNWAAGDRLVFMSYRDGWPHLYSVPASGSISQATLLTPGNFMVEYVAMSPDRRFIVYNANTGSDRNDIDRRHVFKVPVDAATPVAMTSGRGLEWNPAVTSDGKYVAYLASDFQRPPLPTVIPLAGGSPTTIAADRLPADFPSASLVTPEPVVVRSSDGVDVHCQLFKTPGADARRPALVYVHGGPPRQMLLGWHYMYYYANDYAGNQLLANRGFIVLSVNYRLGIGYGLAFQDPERAGPRGAAEYLDVIAAGKYLQSRSDVDPKRIGIWGGSYGGYLTALALGRNSDVFAAGVDIHGVHNWNRQGRAAPDLSSALAGDGITEADLKEAAKVTY